MIDPPSSSTVTVAVGSPFILTCTSRGSPPDTFSWRKDSGPIIQSTSISTVEHTSATAVFRADYYINSVTLDDSGTYICTVTNPIGSDSETITVGVYTGKYLSIHASCKGECGLQKPWFNKIVKSKVSVKNGYNDFSGNQDT